MLSDIIQHSNSNDIVKDISNKMVGKTFHHHYHILYDIRTLLGETPKIYTEIGTYCGGSLCLMLQHNFNTDIYCIDPLHVLNNQEDILNSNIKKYNINNRNIEIYKEYSTDNKFINKLVEKNFKTDILFIDGDHSYAAVLNDFYQYEKFVNKGGFIVFDDYLDYKYSPDVRKAVDYIVNTLDKTQYNIIGTLPNYKNAFTNGAQFNYLNEFIIQKI